MTHHPSHLQIAATVETRRTPVLVIDGQTYGGTEHTVEVLRRDYYGYVICAETDIRGAEYGETVYIEGIEGDFSSDESAADHIDILLGEDLEGDWLAYREEHALRSWQLV